MTSEVYEEEYVEKEIVWEEAYSAWLKFEIGLTKLKTHRGRSNRIFEAWKSPKKYGLDSDALDLKFWLPVAIDNSSIIEQSDLCECLQCCLEVSQMKLRRLKKMRQAVTSMVILPSTDWLTH